jgi:glycosyltransferase involved in cell wall biosynthesis
MISILMPIYNGFEFIKDSVVSVLNQTYEDWELIIGINGHPPDSQIYQSAKSLETVSNKIHVYDLHAVRGKANALNTMLQYCAYERIAILDVDDIWTIDKLEKQVPFLEYYDVVGSQCIYFGDINGHIPGTPVGDLSVVDFTIGNPVINSSAIIKKELCQWNENGIEDYDLWLRLRKQNKTFYNYAGVLVKHRIHSASAFNSKGHDDKVGDLLAEFRRI